VILPGFLYLGDWGHAEHEERLREMGIKRYVSVCSFVTQQASCLISNALAASAVVAAVAARTCDFHQYRPNLVWSCCWSRDAGAILGIFT
jgi:Holliday junction resolvasome RuvABC endonuclease subunit